MGQEIVYCAKCGVRLKEDAFRVGQAFAISNRNWCVGCIQALLPALSEAGQARVQELMHRQEDPPKAEAQPEEA
ncbi:MAG TPA: hypothetical protein VI643_06315, partial [Planctomycetota bacterium]|nr:hypothetical protein [Planctomycetota bacterium]